MAVRQYIGARYVPIYDGDWDNTKVYEPLTMVTYNNSTYTSKQTVPAGTVPTNTTYWVMSATMSGAITQLQSDVSDIQSDIGDMTQLQIGSDLVDAINDLYTQNKNRRYVFIGDSYLEEPYAFGVTWGTSIKTIMGLTQDVNFFCYGEGGAAIYRQSPDYSHNAKEILQIHSTDITNHDTITDIVFGLGINDVQNTIVDSDIEGAFSALKTYVASEYPNAKIWIAFTGNVIGWSNYTLRERYFRVVERYQEYSADNGFIYMEGIEYILHDKTCFDFNSGIPGNNAHPNTLGGQRLAKYISLRLNGSNAPYMNRVTGTCTVGSQTTAFGTAPTFEQVICGPVVKTYISRFSATGDWSNLGGTNVNATNSAVLVIPDSLLCYEQYGYYGTGGGSINATISSPQTYSTTGAVSFRCNPDASGGSADTIVSYALTGSSAYNHYQAMTMPAVCITGSTIIN